MYTYICINILSFLQLMILIKHCACVFICTHATKSISNRVIESGVKEGERLKWFLVCFKECQYFYLVTASM